MINKELNNVIETIEIDKTIDTHNNKEIKNLYKERPNKAIGQVLAQNKKYYFKIISTFSKMSDAFLASATLEAINKALEQLDVEDVDYTYITYSGTLLRNIVTKEYTKLKADKRGGEENDLSFDKALSEGFDFERNSLIVREDSIDSFKKTDLIDYIDRKEDLSEIQKEIGKMYISTEGKIHQQDIADILNLSQQSVSYHLGVLKSKIEL